MHRVTILPVAALPGAGDDSVSVSGDVLTVNGAGFDLSSVGDGDEATATGDHPFIGAITRTGGDLVYALLYHYNTATAEPEQASSPTLVELTSGALPDPVSRVE